MLTIYKIGSKVLPHLLVQFLYLFLKNLGTKLKIVGKMDDREENEHIA